MSESDGASESETEVTPVPQRRRRSVLARVIRGVLLLLAIIIALPILLSPLYIVVDPVSMPMLGRWLQGQRVERQWRPIEQISDRLKAAVIMSEDGQFCRHMGVDLRALTASEVMHPNPRTVRADALAVEAADLMESNRVTSLLVVDDAGSLTGALNSNDLMRAKVI